MLSSFRGLSADCEEMVEMMLSSPPLCFIASSLRKQFAIPHPAPPPHRQPQAQHLLYARLTYSHFGRNMSGTISAGNMNTVVFPLHYMLCVRAVM